MVLLPLLPFTLTFLWVSLAAVWARLVGRRRVCGLHRKFMCENSKEVRAYLMDWLSVSVPFLNIVYNGLCMKTLNTFSCIQLRDGSSVLAVATDVVCWDSGRHRSMVAVSAATIVLYIIGIPAYVFCTMIYAHRNDKLKDPEFLQVVGFLYTRYGAHTPCRVHWWRPSDLGLANGMVCPAEPNSYLWELAFLMRRLSFCLCLVVFRFQPFAQEVRSHARRPVSSCGPSTEKSDISCCLVGRCSVCNCGIDAHSIQRPVRSRRTSSWLPTFPIHFVHFARLQAPI